MASFLLASFVAAGCASSPADDSAAGQDDALTAKADEHWFYGGDLPALEDVKVTVSLVGNTTHIRGTLPAGEQIPALPHVRTHGRRVDIVYPMATAKPGTSNSRPGTYHFQSAMPYKPNALATTVSQPTPHFVTWGGFPFIAYNGGIAFHGPITAKDNAGEPDMNVWYLRRGRVSGGCNRMMGEHVVELANLIGVSMRKVYRQRQELANPSSADVVVLDDYDKLDYQDGTPAKYIDVDYPTDDEEGARITRPGTVHGADNVVMFGSWIASETPDGRDLPASMSGLAGPYVFAEHALTGKVCSYKPNVLKSLAKIAAAQPSGQLPKSLCEPTVRKCVLDLIGMNGSATEAAIAQGAEDAAPCLGVTMR